MTEEQMQQQFNNMQDALFDCIANQPCTDPMEAVMALSSVLCELLVEIGMDRDEIVLKAMKRQLEFARERYQTAHSTDIH